MFVQERATIVTPSARVSKDAKEAILYKIAQYGMQ